MGRRKANQFEAKGVEMGQCDKCLHVYPLLPRLPNGNPAPLCPPCDCGLEEAVKGNTSQGRGITQVNNMRRIG